MHFKQFNVHLKNINSGLLKLLVIYIYRFRIFVFMNT